MLRKFLKKILPPEDKKFYELFILSTENLLNSSQLFKEIIENDLSEERFQQALTIKNHAHELAVKTLNELNSTFITPIDREDILRILGLLEKSTKLIIRGCVYIRAYKLNYQPNFLLLQANSLLETASELRTLFSLFSTNGGLNSITNSHSRMQSFELCADEIFFNAMNELFSGKYESLEVIKLRDICRSIESASDTCLAISETILHVVLKQN